MAKLSVRGLVRALYGRSGSVSVAEDLFGLWRGRLPRSNGLRASVRDYAATLRGPHVHLNVMPVGADLFDDRDDERVDYAVVRIREIYARVGIGIGRIGWLAAASADSFGLDHPTDLAQFAEITHRWSGPGRAIDVFIPFHSHVVSDVGDIVGGQSAEPPGPCDKSSKRMNGVVVALSPSREDMAVVFAHEVGHYLGLGHAGDVQNLMFPGAIASSTMVKLTQSQGLLMSLHCMIHHGLEL